MPNPIVGMGFRGPGDAPNVGSLWTDDGRGTGGLERDLGF